MTAATELQVAAAHYDALAAALKAKMIEMNNEFEKFSFEQRETIPGATLAAMANGVEAALHAAQAQLSACLIELAPERDL